MLFCLFKNAEKEECDTKLFKEVLANHWSSKCNDPQISYNVENNQGKYYVVAAERPAEDIITDFIGSDDKKKNLYAEFLYTCLKMNDEEFLKKQQQKEKK